MFLTRYGSHVRIIRSNLQFATAGVALVQAEVIQAGKTAPVSQEVEGELVNQKDPFTRGWIPYSHLISSEDNQEEVIQACVNAPQGTPTNLQALLSFYWPGIFGNLTTTDVVSTTTIMAGGGDTPASGFARLLQAGGARRG